MSLINIKNLTFGYDGSYDMVFENVNLQIDSNWKLGLIGRNGRGKTTLLNLLMGSYKYQGEISSNEIFDYFPFPVNDENKLTIEVLNELAPTCEDWEFMRELSYINTDVEILWREFNTLSGGEKTKVKLISLFLKEGHFFLLDEPTNHLDVESRRAVANYLKSKKGFILVSHDRAFLDECIDHVLSINKKSIDLQAGNYSSWRENKDRLDSFERSQNDKLEKEISKLNAASKRSASWSNTAEKAKFGTTNSGSKIDRGFVSHKAAKVMKRSKAIEKREQSKVDEKSGLLHDLEREEIITMDPLSDKTGTLIRFENFSAEYDGIAISYPVTFDISQGEIIALDGINGSGKSSILKSLNGDMKNYVGEINRKSGLKISYVPQDTSSLAGSLDDVVTSCGIDKTKFYTVLTKFGFSRSLFDADIGTYSEGQKKKVLLARSVCESAHVYVWDEPLNYIDIDSRIQIEKMIAACNPTMILVEHDISFRNNVCTDTVNIEKANR